MWLKKGDQRLGFRVEIENIERLEVQEEEEVSKKVIWKRESISDNSQSMNTDKCGADAIVLILW